MNGHNTAETYDEQCLIKQAIDNFLALVDDADYTGIINMMGIEKFQFLKRKQMRAELYSLRIALWRLALSHSFPNSCNQMFEDFLKRYLESHPGKASLHIAANSREYWGMIEPVGDADFHNVAYHLVSFIETGQNCKALALKMALHIRRDYRFIFDRLI